MDYRFVDVMMKRSIQYLLVCVCWIGLNACSFTNNSPLQIEVVGENYEWSTRYAGNDGLLHTQDDIICSGDIYVPVNETIQIHLTSKDNMYFWFLDEYKQKGLAMLDRVELLNFETARVGKFPIEADQFCGFAHESLQINFVVVNQEKFKQQLLKM